MADELDLTPWTSYPTGNVEDWVERYAPLVREDRVLREVDGAAISVLVVAWNTPDDVVLALDAIRASAARCAAPVEVLLVDNGGLTAAQAAIDERVDRAVHMVGNVRLCRAQPKSSGICV